MSSSTPLNPTPKPETLKTQVGGSHYKGFAIEPAEFLGRNKIGWLEGDAIVYLCRHALKGGAEDVKKAIHFCRMILEMTYGQTEPSTQVPTPVERFDKLVQELAETSHKARRLDDLVIRISQILAGLLDDVDDNDFIQNRDHAPVFVLDQARDVRKRLVELEAKLALARHKKDDSVIVTEENGKTQITGKGSDQQLVYITNDGEISLNQFYYKEFIDSSTAREIAACLLKAAEIVEDCG